MAKKEKVPPRETEHALCSDESKLECWLRSAGEGETFYSHECDWELRVCSVSGRGCCKKIGLEGDGVDSEERTVRQWMKVLSEAADALTVERLEADFRDRAISYCDREEALFKLARFEGRRPDTVLDNSDTMSVGDAYHCPYCGSPVGQCSHLLLSVNRVSGEADDGALYKLYEKAGEETRKRIIALAKGSAGDEEFDDGESGPGADAYHMYYAGDPKTGERLKEEARWLFEFEMPDAEEEEKTGD